MFTFQDPELHLRREVRVLGKADFQPQSSAPFPLPQAHAQPLWEGRAGPTATIGSHVTADILTLHVNIPKI